MAWWLIVLIILGSIIVGLVAGVLLGYSALRLMQKRKAASELKQLLYWKLPSWGKGVWNRVFAAIIIIITLGTLGTLGYVISTPKVGETFTEFYILGLEGKAADYPRQLEVSEEGRVIIGLINHEDKKINYRVQVVVAGIKYAEVGPIVLVNEQIWEGEIAFIPVMPSDNQKVEFLLYKEGEVEPYLGPLYIFIDVAE